ncbi:hypothetical protein C0416_02205 [bacterium]|nr:hypothetical protein [bacterium]
MSTQAEKTFTVSREEAAKIMKLSTRTLDRYIKGRKLSNKNIAGRIFLNMEEVNDFSKKKRTHRNIKYRQPQVKRAMESQPMPDVFIESGDRDIYRNLYEEVQRDLKGFQQRLEGANYRVGQLEAQLKSSVPVIEHQKLLVGHKKERYNKRVMYILLAIILGIQPIWLVLAYL